MATSPRGFPEYARLVARNNLLKIVLFDWEVAISGEQPAHLHLEISTMGLQEIRKRLERIRWRLLRGPIQNVLDRNQTSESGHANASDKEQSKGLERRFSIPGHVDGQVAASAGYKPRKRDITAGANVPAKKHLCADDVARGILGSNSNATISNVLVVGTQGSKPLKRMEIHLDEPEQVPAFFNSLATALKSSGFDLHTARSSRIPATEIWLTCPLDNVNGNNVLLSRAALIGDQVVGGLAIQASSSPDHQQNPATQSTT